MNDARESGTSRRNVLLAGAATACGALLLGQSAVADDDGVPRGGAALPLTMAGYAYDRVRALQSGHVSVQGCDATFVEDGIGPMNTHAFSGPQTRDVTEIGLLPFLLAWCNDDFRAYDLLPIPILRLFRHKSIFIRTDRGIEKPQDLRGRRVATVGYSSSGLTWVRGILKDEYGVAPEDVEWVVTGDDSSSAITGGVSAWEKVAPKGLTLHAAPEGKDDSDLLAEGAVDAIFHPAEPRIFVEGHPKVDRLFPDHRTVERAYFTKTGIFPIMHAVALRHDLTVKHPWLPKAVFDAYSRAKQADYAYMHKMGAYVSTLPWHGQELRETRALMGDNWYPYGVPGSRKALETAFRYAYDQGLAKREVKLEEIFQPSMLELCEEFG